MVQQITDADFQDFSIKNSLIVVKFYADWCGSCKLFSPKFKRISEDIRFKDINFLEVNAEENPETRKAAGVNNLPFLAVFKEGKLVEAMATGKEDVLIQMLLNTQN
jgi:thioredoxin 1